MSYILNTPADQEAMLSASASIRSMTCFNKSLQRFGSIVRWISHLP